MKWYHWVLIGAVVLFVADDLIGRYSDWRKKRDELIRNADLNRYNMAAFRGTRKVEKDQFLS
jgi:hypothetical protein